MIKFFRRVRLSLFSDNKFSKYLFYAMGEIALVMIGILLALQVNTWNQELHNRKLEKEYLNGMLQDLKLDSLDISKVINKAAINVKLCSELIANLSSQIPEIYKTDSLFTIATSEVALKNGKVIYKGYEEDVSTFGEMLTRLTQHRSIDLSRIKFDELLSTGNMDVIQNGDLRTTIQSYYSYMNAGLDYEGHMVNPYFSRYTQVLQDLGLTPYSETSMKDFTKNKEHNEKLIISLKFLLDANLRHLGWSQELIAYVEETKLYLNAALLNL